MKEIKLSKNKIAELEKKMKKLKAEVLKHHEDEHENIKTSLREAASSDVDIKAREEKLRETEGILKLAEELPDDLSSDEATLGSWIKIENEKGNFIKYRLVHPIEADPTKSLISIESPLGKVLEGANVGDVVTISGRMIKVLELS